MDAGTDVVRLVLLSVPPMPQLAELRALTEAVAQATGARAATAYPPHVTLRTGALVPPDRLGDFATGFAAHCAAVRGCTIRTGGMLVVAEPAPFVGLAVEPDPGLLALHRALLAYAPWRKGAQAAFRPHLSLAYDDLPAAALPAARDLLARLPSRGWTWTCDRVGLYRREGDRWRCWRELPLAPV